MAASTPGSCSIQFLTQLRPFGSALAWARPTEYRVTALPPENMRIPGLGEESLSDTLIIREYHMRIALSAREEARAHLVLVIPKRGLLSRNAFSKKEGASEVP